MVIVVTKPVIIDVESKNAFKKLAFVSMAA